MMATAIAERMQDAEEEETGSVEAPIEEQSDASHAPPAVRNPAR